MPLGAFTFVIDGDRLDDQPETTAKVVIRIQGSTVLIDGNQLRFQTPLANGQPVSLPHSVELPTDTTGTDLSTEIGYIATVRTSYGSNETVYFAARPDGATLYMSEIVTRETVTPAESAAAASAAAASAESAADSATLADQARVAAEAVGDTNDTIMAGVVSNSSSSTRAALSSTFVPVLNPKAFGAVGDGVADDTAAIQGAVDAMRSQGGGRVRFPKGVFKVTAQINVTGIVVPSDTFGDRGVHIEGAQAGGTRIVSTHAGTVFRFHGGKMMTRLANLELVGPGKATAGSRGFYWDGPGGNYNIDEVYIRGYETGAGWYDATLGLAQNLVVRECGTGVKFGYNHDIHTFASCRFDYCDTAIHIGFPERDHLTGSQENNDIQFIGCRISNNTVRGLFVQDYGASGIKFLGCYFEGNPKEGDFGVSGQSYTAGPVGVVFDGCYFTPYNPPRPVGFNVYSPAMLLFQGCKNDPVAYTVFCELNNDNAVVEAHNGELGGVSGGFKWQGRFYDAKKDRLKIGRKDAHHADAGILGGPFRQLHVANRTGAAFESWAGINGATGAAITEMRVRDVGGTMRLEGTVGEAYICATNKASLPTASANNRGAILFVAGNGTTTADTAYICLMSSTGTYSWKQIVAG